MRFIFKDFSMNPGVSPSSLLLRMTFTNPTAAARDTRSHFREISQPVTRLLPHLYISISPFELLTFKPTLDKKQKDQRIRQRKFNIVMPQDILALLQCSNVSADTRSHFPVQSPSLSDDSSFDPLSGISAVIFPSFPLI